MTHDDILKKVTGAIDVLIKAGGKYEGLFPSMLDLKTHEMLMEIPAVIPGQRRGDRSPLGSNLIHDETTLRTMYALNRPDYKAAADRYLKRFATHCTDTVTGLFPWGEHAYWDLIEDGIGNSSRQHNPDSTNPAIHDQLRQVPTWLWEKLYEFNPKCVVRFAEGLDYHWKEGEPVEYTRHGEIEVKAYAERHELASFDFARHGGLYVFDWAYAYFKTGREDFLAQIRKMMDYWWTARYEDGLLPTCRRCTEKVVPFYQVRASGQTIGLAVGLLDSAKLLDEKQPELAAQMREQAAVYLNGFLDSPHDLEKGIFITSFKPGDDSLTTAMPVWGSVYGIWPASYTALTCLCCYRHTGDERLLKWSEAVANFYLKEPMPDGAAIPSMDSGLALGLLADLYDITGEARWLDGGMKLAEKLIAVYLDGDLPRGAAGIDWYESQMGPGFLLHSLTRIALLSRDGKNCPLEADYTAR